MSKVAYRVAISVAVGEFYTAWLARLEALDFNALSQDGRADYLVLKNRLEHEACNACEQYHSADYARDNAMGSDSRLRSVMARDAASSAHTP